jgi:hypothetical protein
LGNFRNHKGTFVLILAHLYYTRDKLKTKKLIIIKTEYTITNRNHELSLLKL